MIRVSFEVRVPLLREMPKPRAGFECVSEVLRPCENKPFAPSAFRHALPADSEIISIFEGLFPSAPVGVPPSLNYSLLIFFFATPTLT